MRYLILGTNLAIGTLVLAWVLRNYGAPALGILGTDPSFALLAGFLAAAILSVLGLCWRWRYLLSGLGRPPSLWALALYRSAAHSLAILIPSAKVGGDPLRAWLAARRGADAEDAIASVAIDRTLEIGAATPFSIVFALLLIQQGIPELKQALATVAVGAVGLGIGVAVAVRRLRRGKGIVTVLVRNMRLDRLRVIRSQMETIEASEAAAARLIEEPRRILFAFALGLVTNLVVLAEFALLLSAFDLPAGPTALAAAIFATGAAHMLPVPAGIGVLEGAQMWIFTTLGYSADVGLAVGLAVRLRELAWMLPGLLYLSGRSLAAAIARQRVRADSGAV